MAFVLAAHSFLTPAGGAAEQRPQPVTVLVDAMVIENATRPARHRERLVIRDGRISCIGAAAACRTPDDARTIDARGKWVIPGLVDAHVHISEDDQPGIGALYLAFGITSVRDTGGYPERLRAMRQSFDSGAEPGPRIFMAARPLDGDPPKWPAEYPDVPRRVRSVAEVRDAIADAKRDGADFIKLYGGLTRPLLVAAIREAHRQDLKATADLLEWDDPGTIDDIVAAGLDGLEHLIPEHYGSWERDEPRLRTVIADLVRRKVAVTWTLTLVSRPAEQREPARSLAFAALAPTLRRHVEEMWRNHVVSDFARKLYAEVWPTAVRNAVRLFHESGGMSLVGTDSLWYCCLPGDLLEELEQLVLCGLPPAAALAAATINPAQWLGVRDIGVLKVGGVADLVVLDANPLDDIANIRRVAYVVSRGTVWKPEELIARANRPVSP
jgi:imidazolonepropionase-like amidohydrolase